MSDDEDREHTGGFPKLALAPLALLALPAALVGACFYGLLRFLRLRPSLITILALGASALGALGWHLTGSWASLRLWALGGTEALQKWHLAVEPLIWASLILGPLMGVGMVAWQLYQLRQNPHLREIPNSWMYHLTYRRTPWEILKRERLRKSLSQGTLVSDKASPLGINEDGEYRPVFRYVAEAVMHTLIVGASGSGKSITLLSLILSDLMAGRPVVILDMKRDPRIAAAVAAWCKVYGREFYHLVNGEREDYDIPESPGQATYDPMNSGSTTSKADMVLGMRDFDTSAEVYKQNLTQVLQTVFTMLRLADRNHEALKTTGFFDRKGNRVYDTTEFTERAEIKVILESELSAHILEHGSRTPFNPVARLREMGILTTQEINRIDWHSGGIHEFATALQGDNLDALAQACVGTKIEAEALELKALMDRRLNAGSGVRGAITELQGQMRTIIASEYGQWLKVKKGERSIDLGKLTAPGQDSVILFSINSDSEPEFARSIGSLIMADITNLSASRRNAGMKNMVMVYVDEFQTLVPSSVSGLLEKARGSFIAMTLAQQSFEQIIKASPKNGEAYLGSVLDTCSNFIVHAGMVQDSAERLAKIIGEEEVPDYKVSSRHEGFLFSNNWGNRRQQTVTTDKKWEWIFPPSNFMRLEIPADKNQKRNLFSRLLLPKKSRRSTAVFVTKAPVDAEFEGSTGAVARTVWMIPQDDVLRNYYVPLQEGSEDEEELLSLDFLDEEFSQDEALAASLLEEDNSPEDEGHDGTLPPPMRRSSMDDEEEAGGFVFESLIPEEVSQEIVEEEDDQKALEQAAALTFTSPPQDITRDPWARFQKPDPYAATSQAPPAASSGVPGNPEPRRGLPVPPGGRPKSAPRKAQPAPPKAPAQKPGEPGDTLPDLTSLFPGR